MGNLTHTVSGDIASFRSAARVPIESLKCHFKPKQDLHGYSKPWPAGGGKNLFNINASFQNPDNTVFTATNTKRVFTPYTYCVGITGNNYFEPNNVTSYSIENNTLTVTPGSAMYGVGFAIPVESSTTYRVSFTGTNWRFELGFYESDGTFISFNYGGLNSGTINSFETPASCTMMTIVFNSSSAGTTATYTNIQLEKNSTATSYEPYENICPVEGWNNISLYHNGTNIFDEVYEDGGIDSNGNASSASFIRSKNYIPCIPNGKYYFSYTRAEPYNSNLRLFYYDENKSYITDTWIIPNTVKTFHSKARYIRFYMDSAYKSSGLKDVSINYPSTDTSYHKYTGVIYPITFPVLGKNKLNPSDIIVSNNFELVNNIYQNTNTDTRDSCQLAVQLWKSSSLYLKTAITVANVPIGHFTATFNVDEKECKYLCFKYNGKTRDFILLFPLRFGLRQYTISCDVLANDPTTIGGVQLTNIQLEIGDTATTYEPYNNNNTIYGGYIDITKGEIVAEYGRTIIDSSIAFGSPGDYTTYYRFVKYYNDLGLLNPKKSQYPLSNWLNGTAAPNGAYIGSTKNVLLYLNKNLNISTSNELSSYLAEHPLELIYQLEESIHYPLSKLELKTLLDQNNIQSNANDITEINYQLHDSTLIRDAKKQIIMNEPHIQNASGVISNFNTNIIAPLSECKINFLPVQDGSGDPAPDNVRPITGYTELSLFQYGENKCVPTVGTATTSNGLTWQVDNNGIVKFEGTPTAFSGKEAGKYYIENNNIIHATIIGKNISNIRFDTARFFANSEQVGTVQSGWEGPIPPVSVDPSPFPTAEYLKIILKRSNNNILMKGICIPIVNNKPLTVNTYPVSWENDLGTVYGGYIDLIKGKLIQTHKSVIFDGSESGWDTYASTRQMTFHRKIEDKKIGLGTSIASNFPNVKNTYFWDRELYAQYGDHNSLQRIYVNAPYKMPNLVTEWRAWLAENPMQLVYELATPIEYDLSPVTIKTLLGVNNFWSDVNENIEIKYWKH